MPFRYVPILRTKAGEAAALENLNAAQKDRIFPVFNVSEDPPATFATMMIKAWAQRPMALDGLYNLNFTGSSAAFVALFHQLGQGGIPIIPAIECAGPPPNLGMAQPLIGTYGQGLVVKATLAQIGTVSQWVQHQGWNNAIVDLVIDAGHIGQFAPAVIASLVVNQCNQHVSAAAGWRSVSFVGASVPRDFGALPIGLTKVPRVEWTAWQAIHPLVHLPMNYGDYGIAHPDLEEPPGYVMANATVSVKYTVDDHWLAIKGRQIGGANGIPMPQQYHEHAQLLVNNPQFGGVPNC